MSRTSWLLEAQRPSRISPRSILGTKSYAFFLDHAYEPTDADEAFADLESLKEAYVANPTFGN